MTDNFIKCTQHSLHTPTKKKKKEKIQMKHKFSVNS